MTRVERRDLIAETNPERRGERRGPWGTPRCHFPRQPAIHGAAFATGPSPMKNPYANLPDSAFWKRAVADHSPLDIDPASDAPFTIGRTDRVATAGSCFAQRLSHSIQRQGFNFYVTETGPQADGAIDENYGVYSAR